MKKNLALLLFFPVFFVLIKARPGNNLGHLDIDHIFSDTSSDRRAQIGRPDYEEASRHTGDILESQVAEDRRETFERANPFVCVCKTHFSTPRQRENHIRVHPNHYPVYVRCACGEWFKTVNEQVVHHHAALDPSRQPSRPPSRSSRPHGIVSITGVENKACICGLVYKSEDLLKQHIAAKRHSEDMNRQHLLVKRRPETHAEAKFGKSYFVRRRHC